MNLLVPSFTEQCLKRCVLVEVTNSRTFILLATLFLPLAPSLALLLGPIKSFRSESDRYKGCESSFPFSFILCFSRAFFALQSAIIWSCQWRFWHLTERYNVSRQRRNMSVLKNGLLLPYRISGRRWIHSHEIEPIDCDLWSTLTYCVRSLYTAVYDYLQSTMYAGFWVTKRINTQLS